MPELPDLTIFAESLQQLVVNREIAGGMYHKHQRLNVAPELFGAALKHQRITRVRRVGKELLLELGSGDRFLVHLMLSGGFKLRREREFVAFPILTLHFDDGESLVIFDPKGWVTVTFNPDLAMRAIDALDVTADYLHEAFKRKPRTQVKSFLLDQQIIAGIGNAYSDEILWHARIHPKSPVGRIPDEVTVQLAAAIRSTLVSATNYIRKHHPGITSGEVRDFLSVHNPASKLSPTGGQIKVELVASKKTYYTDEQILYIS